MQQRREGYWSFFLQETDIVQGWRGLRECQHQRDIKIGSCMPTVFRYEGIRFFFYSDEGTPREPTHIHARSNPPMG